MIEMPADQSADATTDLAEVAEFAEDNEPVSMSLDHEASDRTFDRQLAYLGLLDDAAPIFRDGSNVAGVGVLLGVTVPMEEFHTLEI